MKNLFHATFIRLFSVLFLSVGLFSNADAQIWKNFGDKVNEKIQKQASDRLERKVDEKIDKTFDKTEETIDGSLQKNDKESYDKQGIPKGFDLSSFMGGPVEVRPQYKFNIGITYRMTSSENGKSNQIPESEIWMSEEGYTGMNVPQNNSMVVLDIDKSTNVIFQEKDKSYMAMNMNMGGMMSQAIENSEEDETSPQDYKIEKLGTESILGYTCVIYKITTEDGVSTAWITNDIDFKYENMFKTFSDMGGKQKSKVPDMENFPTGMMLKMNFVDAKNGDKMTMEAIKVDTNGRNIQTSSYKKVGM